MNLSRFIVPRSMRVVVRRASICGACILFGFAPPAGEKIAFHPELVTDERLHRWFLNEVAAPALAAQGTR